MKTFSALNSPARILSQKPKIYKYVSTCKNIKYLKMEDRKRMKKVRKKRIKSIQKQVDKHEEKIEKEKGRLDMSKMLSVHAICFSS